MGLCPWGEGDVLVLLLGGWRLEAARPEVQLLPGGGRDGVWGIRLLGVVGRLGLVFS